MTKPFLEEMARIQERLHVLFERALLPSGYSAEESIPGGWGPAVDLVETGDAYVLCAEVPGVRREDVDLRITGTVLELSGGSRPLPEGHQFLRMERSHGRFHRTLDLGGPVDRENIEAHLRDGILTVTLPKLPPAGETRGGET